MLPHHHRGNRRGWERETRGRWGGRSEEEEEEEEEARKKDRQKQGHKKRGPLGCSPLGGGLKKVTSGPPEGAPARQGREKKKEKSREKRGREDIDQVTWGYTHPASVCALMYNTVTSLGGSRASVSPAMHGRKPLQIKKKKKKETSGKIIEEMST